MPSSARIAVVRRFTRFYTRQAGVLGPRLLRSPFALTEARVLYELAHRRDTTASELAASLGIDAGYLSRMLSAFARRGLVSRRRSDSDRRERALELTPKGRRAFAPLDRRSQHETGAMLAALSEPRQRRLVESMQTIERLLAPHAPAVHPASPAFRLRRPRPGDMGWITHRQAVLYHREYGWNEEYEALIAGIMSRFVSEFDPKFERCWIAERDGEIAGSVFLVRKSPHVAQLRLLYVEPDARGLGIGRRLVDECIRFARHKRYRTLTLWTNSVLVSARRIYEAAGFHLTKEEKHHGFGKDLVGQNWDLTL